MESKPKKVQSTTTQTEQTKRIRTAEGWKRSQLKNDKKDKKK